MEKPEFLPRIMDPSLPEQERLVLLVQFVVVNGTLIPSDILSPDAQPPGFLFRTLFIRDLVVCVAIPQSEVAESPKEARADSAQLWQLWLDERLGVVPHKSRVVCTVNGPLTRVTRIDDIERARQVLAEWSQTPPTDEEISGRQDPAHTLQ